MAMGMMGFWVTHPKDSGLYRVDRDYVFLLSSYDIDPGSFTPRVAEMLNFNMWTFNSRVFPGIDPIVARKGDRVRIRIGNLTMTNHPIHLHGHEFEVAGTDGGWVPKSARWPEVTTDIAIGQMRAIEFDATDPGDWAFHCHKSHHTMNAMGHNVPTMIGVDQQGVAEKIRKLIPDYMVMGDTGGSMGDMEMPLPDNTLPMMSGHGPFGGMEMGGMFTVVKIREGLSRNDYKDPGWYKQPPGTTAYEWTGEPLASIRAPGSEKMSPKSGETVLKVTKGGSHGPH